MYARQLIILLLANTQASSAIIAIKTNLKNHFVCAVYTRTWGEIGKMKILKMCHQEHTHHTIAILVRGDTE